MMTSAQCRAARGLIAWSQQQLADAARVGIVTVRQFETEAAHPRNATLAAIRAALESAGIEFTNGESPGVRLRALLIDDYVRLKKWTVLWAGNPDVQKEIGQVEKFVDDGTSVKRCDVKFANGTVLRGIEVGLIELAPKPTSL